MRTVGATEAFWRLYEFDLHNRYPTVVSLDIHLKNEQLMFFEGNTNLQEEVESGPKFTNLTSFFLYNEQNEVGVNNELTYIQFPSRFAWKQKE